MHRHPSYAFPLHAPQPAPAPVHPPPRYASSHSTSSAQSPHANPDEDWTKISDLAERRRIQNRIAQRNYRKKLKRRLEDLERRAGSSPEATEPPLASPAGVRARPDDGGRRKRASKPGPHASAAPRSPVPPPTPQFGARDDAHGMFSQQHTRQLSASPPPAFAFSPFTTADGHGAHHAAYPQHAPFPTLPAPYPDFPAQPLSLPPLPLSRPYLPPYDNMTSKPDAGHFGDEGLVSHFHMGYAPAMGHVEAAAHASAPSSFNHPNAYTPPLSIAHSFGASRDTSPSERSLNGPTTPDVRNMLPLSRVGI